MLEKYKINPTIIDSGILEPFGSGLGQSFIAAESPLSRILIKFSTLDMISKEKGSERGEISSTQNNNLPDKKESQGISDKNSFFGSISSFPKRSTDSALSFTKSTLEPIILPITGPMVSSMVHSIRPNLNTVNLVTGSLADQITSIYGAEALTIGKNIFLPAAKLDLTSPRGLGLLAHELTHIKQQEEDAGLLRGQISPARYLTLEQEAQEKERRVINYLSSKNLGEERLSNYGALQPFVGSFRTIDHVKPLYLSTAAIQSLPYFGGQSQIQGKITEPDELSMGENALKATATAQATRYPSTLLASNVELSEKKESSRSNLAFVAPRKQTLPERPSNVFMAERGRPVEPRAAPSPPSTSASPSPTLDVNRLAEQVYEIIERKIKMQRDRTGFR